LDVGKVAPISSKRIFGIGQQRVFTGGSFGAWRFIPTNFDAILNQAEYGFESRDW